MNCMKCGRETENEQVFCQDCLAVMEKYPVKPGIVIHLPRREDAVTKKQPAAHLVRTPEEQVLRQRSIIRWLTFALVVLVLAFGLAAGLALYLLDQRDLQLGQELTRDLGRNYTVVESGSD